MYCRNTRDRSQNRRRYPSGFFRAYYVDKLLGQRFDIQPISEAIIAVDKQLAGC